MLARWIVSWVRWVVDFLFSVVEAEGVVDEDGLFVVVIVGWV